MPILTSGSSWMFSRMLIMKSAHAAGVEASRGPLRFLESRTRTAARAVSISTQESPSLPQ